VGERDRPGANFPDDHPSFFPDNRRLVFSSNRSNGSNWEIYRMNVDGSGATRLTSSSQEEIEPAWSPDGKQIAFARVQGHSQKDVFVITADGSGLRQVTFADGEDHDATWSPSGLIGASRRTLRIKLALRAHGTWRADAQANDRSGRNQTEALGRVRF
jgi:Tol biopolymer transport system component